MIKELVCVWTRPKLPNSLKGLWDAKMIIEEVRARGYSADDLVHAWHQVRNVETGREGGWVWRFGILGIEWLSRLNGGRIDEPYGDEGKVQT